MKLTWRFTIFFAAFINLASPVDAQTLTPPDKIAKCAAIEKPVDRLSCYDELAKEAKLDRPASSHTTSGKWSLRTDKSKIDDSLTVVLSLQADNQIEGWLAKHRPMLILRCKEKRTEAFITTGMPPHVETGLHDGATATVRFDDKKAASVKMGKSTDGKALFFSDGQAIEHIKKMAAHRSMLFQFTPFNASPVLTTFQLDGLAEPLKQLRTACAW